MKRKRSTKSDLEAHHGQQAGPGGQQVGPGGQHGQKHPRGWILGRFSYISGCARYRKKYKCEYIMYI